MTANKRTLEFIRDINVGYVKTIFSLKKIFTPITPRKISLWLIYVSLFLLFSSFFKLGPFSGIYYYMEKEVWLAEIAILFLDTLVMFMFLAIDPLFLIMSMLFGKRSEQKKDKVKPNEFENIALVISCHKSNDVIEKTLRSAMKYFPPNNIYVADNGNSDVPLDDTEAIVMELDFMINYRWSNRGNKTLAQFLSVNVIMDRDDIKYVMIVDDDTTFPDSLTTSVEKIDDVTKGVMFGIRGVDEDGNQDCLWTKWQDLEYKLGDLVKEIQCKYATVLFPHGAVSLWDKEVFFEILGKHDTIFYADDVKMGIFLMMNGYRLYYNPDVVFETEVPSSIIGKSPNYYNQRVRSWDFAEHMCIFKHFKHFLFGYVRNSWKSTVVMRVFQLYVILSIINDWMKIPLLILYLRRNPNFFFTVLFGNIAMVIICTLLWNYWTCRNSPEIQVDLSVILTSPIYRFISSVIRVISVFHCVFVYWPNYKPSALSEPGQICSEQLELFEEYNGKVSREPTPQIVRGELLEDDIEEGKVVQEQEEEKKQISIMEMEAMEMGDNMSYSIMELEAMELGDNKSYSIMELEAMGLGDIFKNKKSAWSWKRIRGFRESK